MSLTDTRALEPFFDEIRADINELHTTWKLSRALDLSARTGVHFNHNTYPMYFTGDLSARLSNLVLDYNGHTPVGLAQSFAIPGIPMDAYGAACHARYRSLV